MPKILRIINRLNIGGPTHNVGLLTKYLSPEFETLVVSGLKDDGEESSEFILKRMGIEPLYVPNMRRSLNPLKDLPAYIHLKKIIGDFKPDIVHTHAAKAGALGRLAAWECGVPNIVHTFHGHVFHSYFGPVKTRFFLEIERFLARISHQIIAISPLQAKEITETYKVCEAQKVSIVPLGFDLSRFIEPDDNKRRQFRQRYDVQENEVVISIVGRITPIKNHALFIETLRQALLHTQRPLRAFVVGDGEQRIQMERLAAQVGIDFVRPEDPPRRATLTFTSWIKNIDEVYAGTDIVMLTSLNEGTPVTLIEAQAACRPVLSTNVGGVCDVTQQGETALLTPSGNVQELTKYLLQLVENDELRRQMGNKGRQWVLQRHHYTRLANDMAQIYRRLLERNDKKYFHNLPTPS